jgi:hypothetical protein
MNSLGYSKNLSRKCRAQPAQGIVDWYHSEMKRALAFSISVAISIASVAAQDPSPDSGSFEVEPPLLVQPDGQPVVSAEPSPTPALDLAQLEKQLERAKKSAASAERLWKAGILAKVEAEQRALRVVRLEAELAKARLADVQKSTAANDGMVQTGKVQQATSEESKVVLAHATAAAETAATNLVKAELDAATLNLQRQQKLLALGSAHKSDVARAEEKLAALKRGQ